MAVALGRRKESVEEWSRRSQGSSAEAQNPTPSTCPSIKEHPWPDQPSKLDVYGFKGANGEV